MELNIYAFEFISVKDIVEHIKQSVISFVKFILFEEEEKDNEEVEENANSPPALGINVKDVVNTKDIFGRK